MTLCRCNKWFCCWKPVIVDNRRQAKDSSASRVTSLAERIETPIDLARHLLGVAYQALYFNALCDCSWSQATAHGVQEKGLNKHRIVACIRVRYGCI
mmetsp:Transcript_32163/g.99332  ORF Transcript_32163/g.99332 Transcript_32163/m.99332 type:complete len:97 (-) Transcript_32163:2237-2527(-)